MTPAATMAKLRDQARRELVYADQLTPAYREFLFTLVPDFKPPARPNPCYDRLFQAADSLFGGPSPGSRPGDYLFGSKPAAERFQEVATAPAGSRGYDHLFSK
jgi:hypothetical protein